MRTKTKKDPCKDGHDALIAALNSAEAELNQSRAEFHKRKTELMTEVTDWMNRATEAVSQRDALARAKEAWLGECGLLHARLDEIQKLAAKELIFEERP